MTTSLTSEAQPAGASGGTLPLPRVTARGVLLAATLWTLYAVLYTGVIVSLTDAPFVPVLIGQLMHVSLMGVLSLGPWWLIVRSMAERPMRQRLLAHAPGIVGYAGAVTVLMLGWARLLGEEAYYWTLTQVGWIAFGTAFAYVAQFAVYHAVAASRRADARERQTEQMRHLAREQELRTLRSQLNPHFLFNALNTVNAQIGRAPDDARETVGRLADLLRYALDAGRRDRVPLAEELAFTRDYLDLEHARMGSRLRTVLDIAPAASGEVPPMSIQTLVENAVRHAVAANPEGGTISVSVAPAASGVRVEVRDSGAGSGNADPGTGIGLANTDERLRLLFGENARLHIDRAPTGWTVSFTVPAPEAVSPEASGAMSRSTPEAVQV